MAPGADGACSSPAASTSAAAASASGPKAGDAGGLAAAASAAKKGPWTAAEDAILTEYVRRHGEGNWNAVQRSCGLSRCGKSCRLRWANHLRPNLKKGPFSPAEERLILELHSKLGNKWAHMAAQLPGRTDNEIKNYWNTRTKRRQRAGLPLYPPDIGRHHATSLGRQRPPTVALGAPSLADHRALYSTSVGATPLSLSNFVTSPPPPLPPPVASPILLDLWRHQPAFLVSTSQRPPKRLRGGDADAGSFCLPFNAANPVTPLPISSSQELFAFNPLAGYDLGPPPPPAQQEARHHPPGFPVKVGLPSSQVFTEPCNSGALLDALLGDTRAVLGGGDVKGGVDGCGLLPEGSPECGDRELVLGIVGGRWDDPDYPAVPAMEAMAQPAPAVLRREKHRRTTADHSMACTPRPCLEHSGALTRGDLCSTDVVPEREAAEDGGGSVIEDDLLALLDLIPATAGCSASASAPAAAFSEWSNGDSGEASNGQSSGLTNDDGGREAQHPFAIAAEDLGWSIGSCHRNDLPRRR